MGPSLETPAPGATPALPRPGAAVQPDVFTSPQAKSALSLRLPASDRLQVVVISSSFGESLTRLTSLRVSEGEQPEPGAEVNSTGDTLHTAA